MLTCERRRCRRGCRVGETAEEASERGGGTTRSGSRHLEPRGWRIGWKVMKKRWFEVCFFVFPSLSADRGQSTAQKRDVTSPSSYNERETTREMLSARQCGARVRLSLSATSPRGNGVGEQRAEKRCSERDCRKSKLNNRKKIGEISPDDSRNIEPPVFGFHPPCACGTRASPAVSFVFFPTKIR